jgi:glycosyltransferase involved in cell wall biosynthesis
MINRDEHDLIRARLAALQIDPALVELRRAKAEEMPDLVRRMHAGLSLIKPCFSKLSSSPTKLAEYLGCGVPGIGNFGVGDMGEILETYRCGVALRDFSQADIEDGVDRLLALTADPQTPQRCVAAAREVYALDVGVARYREMYRALMA